MTIQGAAGSAGDVQKKGGGVTRPTPEQEAGVRARLEEIKKWRRALPRGRFADARKKFNDQGILIDIVKFDDLTNRVDSMEDDEIDYCFEMAKALGAHAISCEPPVSKNGASVRLPRSTSCGWAITATTAPIPMSLHSRQAGKSLLLFTLQRDQP